MSRRIRLLALASAGLIMVFAATQVASGTSQTIPLQSVSAYDMAQLGLELKPIPASRAAAAALPEAAAVEAAAAELGAPSAAEPEVVHAMVSVVEDEAPRSVYVVVYEAAGEDFGLSWGPYSDGATAPKLRFHGALIDDATGDVLGTFGAASQ